jgi:hypothetical protein
MNYELKDKINVTDDLLHELETKCWQEIEQLQVQIANLSEGATNDKLRQLLKNLLTSYYVFTGGVESLIGEPIDNTVLQQDVQIEEPVETVEHEAISAEPEISISDEYVQNDNEVSDPFEYFVDFDDPVGDPISDDDLYNN